MHRSAQYASLVICYKFVLDNLKTLEKAKTNISADLRYLLFENCLQILAKILTSILNLWKWLAQQRRP